MGTIVTNMHGCNTGHEALMIEQYGEEVMYAGWNPQLPLVGEGSVAQTNRQVNLPPDLADVDVDVFLKRMYKYQC